METVDVTILIAVRNEVENISACLDGASPARRVLVVDSASEDGTADIARDHGAEVLEFRWNGRYPRKRQWALDHADIETPWVLLLDADERIPEPLWGEIREVVSAPESHAAYFALKQFHFMGRVLRFGGFSHSAICLFRTGRARFEHLLPDSGEDLDMEVHERLQVEGSIGRLKTPLIHWDAKGLHAYLARHNAYSTWEAANRLRLLSDSSTSEDRIRPRLRGNLQEHRRFLKQLAMRLPGEPWLWFLYHFILRGGVLEGRRGWIASQIRRAYIEQVRAKMLERSHSEFRSEAQ